MNRIKFQQWLPSSLSPSSYNDIRTPLNLRAFPISPFNHNKDNNHNNNNTERSARSTPDTVNHKKRPGIGIEDLNPNKITVLPIPSVQKHQALMLLKQKSLLQNNDRFEAVVCRKELIEDDTNVMSPLTANEIEMRRLKALKAAEHRKKLFSQGGGGEKIKNKAQKLEELQKKKISSASPLRWTVG